MFTTVAYVKSQDTGGVLTNVAAIADQHVRVSGDDVIVPDDLPFLCGAYAGGTTITGARISSPALRRTLLLDVSPLNVGAEPLSPTPLFNAFYSPLPLDADEALNALVAEGATGAEYEEVVVFLGDGAQSPVSGDIYTVRATGSTTLTAYAWSNVPLTFAQTLPAGRYQLVGLRAISAGAIAARCVFVGGTWRPGCIACDAESDLTPDIFRRGALGVWGEFEHNTPPTIDFLSISADTSEVVYLDLIKVA
jgi:hypothetical protein